MCINTPCKAHIIPLKRVFEVSKLSDTSVDGSIALYLPNGTQIITHISNIIITIEDDNYAKENHI